MSTFDARVLSGIGVLAAVVEAKSFAAAANALGLTQSGVSRAIARLEERVGIRLLHRTARAVTLTGEGQRFYDRVAPLVSGIEDATNEAGGASKNPKGLLRVAVDPIVARVLLAPRIAGLLGKHPELSLDMVVRERLGDLVTEGFDAAIRFGELEPSNLVVRKLLDTRVVTCASEAYLQRRGRPKKPRDLEQHECILFREPNSGRPYEWIFQRGKKIERIKAHGRLILNDSAAALAACRAGHGIAQHLELELRESGATELVDLLPSWGDEVFPLYVYLPSRAQIPAKVRALIDFVVAASR
jgi:DNA-binding transcriptional LysR family regulator